MGCVESKACNIDLKKNLPLDNKLISTKISLTIIHDNEPDNIILLWSKVAEAMYFDVHLISLNFDKLNKSIDENLLKANEKQTNQFHEPTSSSTLNAISVPSNPFSNSSTTAVPEIPNAQPKKNANILLLQNQIYSNVLTIQDVLAEKLSGTTVEIVLIDMRNSKYDQITHSICHYFRILYPSGSDVVLVALISKVTSGGIKCPNDSIPSEIISNGFNKYFVSSNNLSSIVRELFIFNCNEISYLRKLRNQSNLMLYRTNPVINPTPSVTTFTNKEGFPLDENSQIPDLKTTNLQNSSPSGLASTSERMKTILESDEKKLPNNNSIRRNSTRNSIVSGTSSLENYNNRFNQKRLSSSIIEFPATEKINLMNNRKKWNISFINRMTNYILNEREIKLRLFQAIKRPRRNKRSSSTDIDLEKSFHGRRKESWARIQSYGVNSSLNRIIQVIQSAQLTCGPQASKDLQSALDLILSNDLFCGILKYDQTIDKPMDEVISGLLTNADRHKQSGDRRLAKKSVVNLSITLQDIPKEYQDALEDDNKWDFDVINLERITEKKPLLYLGMKIFSRFDICNFLKCSQLTANHWLTLMEQNYHSSNSYHNSTHAADVMQSCAYLLQKESLSDSMTQEDIAATILAAIIHDVDHPGKTNQFLVITKHELAILYNDIAVLEHHHASYAFKLTLENSVCNIFSNLDNDSFKSLRSQMINLVLATELSVHNNHLSQFISVLSQQMIARHSQIEDRSSGQLELYTKTLDSDGSLNKGQLNKIFLTELLSSEENKMILKRMIIKCSDVNNPTRKLELCKLWAERIANEYFNQIDEEIRLGFKPLTMPPFNRKTCNLAFTQVKFIEFFLSKMFPALDSVLDCPELMENFEANLSYWQKESEASGRTV